jgi:Rad3-related DNA helicase
MDIENFEEKIDFIFSENGIMKQINPNYSPRESQIEAAKIIASSLEKRGHAIVEGPCGFGKTYAYLAPVISSISESGKRVVIATSGIGLQEQLYNKDIPAMVRAHNSMSRTEISYAMLKGMTNYICLSKISELMMSRNYTGSKTDDIIKLYKHGKLGTGDLSALNIAGIDDITKMEVSCAEETCEGSSCPNRNQCFYRVARARAKAARIAIVNYHLLFQDIKAGGKILGPYGILIFDEAHEAPKIMRDFYEEKASYGNMLSIRNKLSEITNIIKSLSCVQIDIPDFKAQEFLSVCEKMFGEMWTTLFSFNSGKFVAQQKVIDDRTPIFLNEKVFQDFNSGTSYVLNLLFDLSDEIEQSLPFSEDGDKNNDSASIEKLYNLVSSTRNRLEAMYKLISSYREAAKDTNVVVWADADNKNNRASLHCKPVMVAEEMAKHYFNNEDEKKSCIVTSATLSVNGGFSYIKSQMGIDIAEENVAPVSEFVGSSPFDLENQELWYLPENAVDGDNKNSKQFRELLPEQVKSVISASGGGALCLFTSYSNLEHAYNGVAGKIGSKIISQKGMMRKEALDIFTSEKDTSLFATRSFFTGVDIPGDSLRCVIIDKLPFPNPSDPVMKKMSEILGNRTFADYYLPEMIISLKQAIGRGVRTVNDKCVIALLDNRMATARYKGVIASSFPYSKTSTRKIEDVQKFFNN